MAIEINIDRQPYSFACCANRMNEFYTFDELDFYVHNIMINNLEIHRAIYFLDLYTRFDYFRTRGEEPDINHYLLKYLIEEKYKGNI